jgi:hypothetical protein
LLHGLALGPQKHEIQVAHAPYPHCRDLETTARLQVHFRPELLPFGESGALRLDDSFHPLTE